MESNSLMIFQSSNEKLKPIFSQVKLLVKINDLSLKLVVLQDKTKDFISLNKGLFIHGKAMVLYVQLSTSYRIGFQCNEKIFFNRDKIMKPTVGWQLHKQYQSLPVYKEFPALNN